MPVSYRIHELTGFVLVTGSGTMTYSEWRACLEAVIADPRYRPGSRILSDRRRLEGGYSTATIEQIAQFLRSRAVGLGPARWAVLTKDQDADYGMVRMAEILAHASLVQVHAFTELEAALRWLLQVVDEEQLEALRVWVEQGH